MADGSITIETNIDQKGIKDGVKNIENSFDKLKNTLATTLAAIGLGNLVKDFVSAGVSYNAEIEKYTTSLKTLTGSAENAEKVMAQIKKDAAKTPFDVKGLTQANQLLISTGLSSEEARTTILALGDAVAATGGGNDELARMALNLQQVKNIGYASSVDIKQFAMAGIDVYSMLANYLGVTKQEAAEMKISWEDLNGALIAASQEGGTYFNAMAEQSTTLNGQWSTLKDNFQAFTGEAVQPLTNFLKDKLLPAINDIITGAKGLKSWINEHKTLITVLTGVIGTLTAAFVAYTIAVNAHAIALGLMSAATTVATGVSSAFAAVLTFLTSPITLVVAAIGALITTIVLLVQNWDTVKAKAIEVWGKISDFVGEAIAKIKEKISTVIDIGKNIVENLWQGINDAKDWLVGKVKEFGQGIIDSIKGVLGIHSPSTKMAEIGDYLVQGLWERH